MPRAGSRFTAASFVLDLRPEPELAAPLPLWGGKMTALAIIRAVAGELSARLASVPDRK